MTAITTTTFVIVFALLAIAALTLVLAVGAFTGFVAAHRKQRLARHQTIRSYWGRTALTH